MFNFDVRGTVAGFNTLSDGRTILKIKPEVPAGNLSRDELPGIMDITIPNGVPTEFALNARVHVHGKESCVFRVTRDEKTGKVRNFANFRHEAESIDALDAV
jgi:hypothetical protein